ncbi:hypothetical protein Cadr_000030198 [Camelus dromedarius]|uniref:Uncharacterized protein n=1 Tax=Camelus dromedarius TaxID=9838 RepID=A0A5N4C0C4_CAMDR|nr:hypothetical protein Cadr_000030198 [Camelus dromedarius]
MRVSSAATQVTGATEAAHTLVPGLPVTTEDLDMEKEAAFPSINSTLRGETQAVLAPPAPDTEVTPKDTIPPSQHLLLGAPPTASGSIFPSMQALQMSPSDSMALVTPALDTGVTPMDTTPPSQPRLLRLSLSPVAASSNLCRPCRLLPVTAWPKSSSPPACLHSGFMGPT